MSDIWVICPLNYCKFKHFCLLPLYLSITELCVMSLSHALGNFTLLLSLTIGGSRVISKVIRIMFMTGFCKPVFFFFFFFFFLVFLLFFWTASAAYGGSQARGLIGAVAASLHHSHSNARFKPHLQPTPELVATPDPQTTERSQGSNPKPHGS